MKGGYVAQIQLLGATRAADTADGRCAPSAATGAEEQPPEQRIYYSERNIGNDRNIEMEK